MLILSNLQAFVYNLIPFTYETVFIVAPSVLKVREIQPARKEFRGITCFPYPSEVFDWPYSSVLSCFCLVPRRERISDRARDWLSAREHGKVLCANAEPSHIPLRELLVGLFPLFLLFSDTFETPGYEASHVCVFFCTCFDHKILPFAGTGNFVHFISFFFSAAFGRPWAIDSYRQHLPDIIPFAKFALQLNPY